MEFIRTGGGEGGEVFGKLHCVTVSKPDSQWCIWDEFESWELCINNGLRNSSQYLQYSIFVVEKY